MRTFRVKKRMEGFNDVSIYFGDHAICVQVYVENVSYGKYCTSSANIHSTP